MGKALGVAALWVAWATVATAVVVKTAKNAVMRRLAEKILPLDVDFTALAHPTEVSFTYDLDGPHLYASRPDGPPPNT